MTLRSNRCRGSGESSFVPSYSAIELSLFWTDSKKESTISIVVLFDEPFNFLALDEALFSVASQDYEPLDVIVVSPTLGELHQKKIAELLISQPWPDLTRLRVCFVNTESNSSAPSFLINAGIAQSTGRFISFLDHRDLVYSHAYGYLIDVLLHGASVAFGGLREAFHSHGTGHWMVDSKRPIGESSYMEMGRTGRLPVHCFVVDQEKFSIDGLFVAYPEGKSAFSVWLSRLAGQTAANFSFSTKAMFELRHPPGQRNAEIGNRCFQTPANFKSSAMPTIVSSENLPVEYKSIPIFINARDVLTPMSKLIGWLLDAGYTSINVLDNDSSYPPLLDYYRRMRKEIKVFRLGANIGHTSIWDMDILGQLDIKGPYVWTDPDIYPIEECPKNVLEMFWNILTTYPSKSKAGFGLRIDDLPSHYKLKADVIAWEKQFWEKEIVPGVFDASIDTTFALYRPGSRYDLSGIRTGFPYVARHAPWYTNSEKPSEEFTYYLTHARHGLNNWGAASLSPLLNDFLSKSTTEH